MHSHGPNSVFDPRQSGLYETFKSGDLLYGLQTARARFLGCLNEKSDQPLTPDKYNNVILPTYAAHKQDPSFPFNLTPKKAKHFSALKSVSVEKVRPDAPLSSYQDYFNKTQRRFSNDERRIRRACKAALLRKDVTKHFLLDGINLLEVFNRGVSVSRNGLAMKTSISYDSYTSAELRFALRYFHLIQDSILFYRAGERVHLFDRVSVIVFAAIRGYLQRKNATEALAAIEKYRNTLSSNATSSSLSTSVGSPPRSSSLSISHGSPTRSSDLSTSHGSPAPSSPASCRLFTLVPKTPRFRQYSKQKARTEKYLNPTKRRALEGLYEDSNAKRARQNPLDSDFESALNSSDSESSYSKNPR